MATIYYTWNAPLAAQVNTITPANVASGDMFTITISDKTVTITAGGSDTVATIAAALAAACAAAAFAEFQEIRWTSSAAAVTATAATAGANFIQTSAATGGSATLTTTATTANSGPSDASCGLNYSSGSLPANGDSLIISGDSSSILYGLAALSGVSLASLTINASFTGLLGLPQYTASGYAEYRPQYFEAPAATLNIGVQDVAAGAFGQSPVNASGRVKIDSGSGAVDVYVYQSGSAADSPLPPILWKGTNSANTLTVQKGSVGVAMLPGETASVADWYCSYVTQQATDAALQFGPGVTFASSTATVTGGTVALASDIATINITGGVLTVSGAATVGALTNFGGTVYYQSTGSCSAYSGNGRLDFSRNGQPRTFSAITLYKGFYINDPSGTLTATAGFALAGCQLSDGGVVLGFGPTIFVTY